MAESVPGGRHGSIRRGCKDHIIVLGEGHLRKILREYAAYYNGSPCQLPLDLNAPEPRAVEGGRGPVQAAAQLGGLHHRYSRAA